MAALNHDQAIFRMNELMKLIRAGAYQERDHNGNYGEDGIEKAVDDLEYSAAQEGLHFIWHEDIQTHSLEPMSAEEFGAFKAADEPTLRECPYCHQLHQAEHIERCPLKPG